MTPVNLWWEKEEEMRTSLPSSIKALYYTPVVIVAGSGHDFLFLAKDDLIQTIFYFVFLIFSFFPLGCSFGLHDGKELELEEEEAD